MVGPNGKVSGAGCAYALFLPAREFAKNKIKNYIPTKRSARKGGIAAPARFSSLVCPRTSGREVE
jgi:hypothetical protein